MYILRKTCKWFGTISVQVCQQVVVVVELEHTGVQLVDVSKYLLLVIWSFYMPHITRFICKILLKPISIFTLVSCFLWLYLLLYSDYLFLVWQYLWWLWIRSIINPYLLYMYAWASPRLPYIVYREEIPKYPGFYFFIYTLDLPPGRCIRS